MNEEDAILFLFSIAQEIKRAFDTPVILLTMKDYAECVTNSLVEIRTALLHCAAPERVVGIISDFHLTWLEAVKDIECFKRQIKDTPRDTVITKTVDFTINCAVKRKEYFQQYIDSLKNTMSLQEYELIGMDLRTITDMNINLQSALREKQQTIRNMVDPNEYFNKVLDETEELMNWLDVLNDNLAIQFSKFVGVRFPTALLIDLSKTLQQLIEEVTGSSNQEMNEIVDEMQLKSESVSNTIRDGAGDELEERIIIEKIKDLENRIVLLKHENSYAVAALQHKAMFLTQRLDMMRDLKLSLCTLKSKIHDTLQPKSKGETHMFDHLLPKQDRQRLVEGLIKLWSDAVVSGLEVKSLISILSVADMKETFCDDLGKFVIDKYGRKLYTLHNDELSLYQTNEKNELVPLSDDDKHIYFYDDCGRYYINEIKRRVYTAHREASEYMLHCGVLVKTKEVRNGIAYYYDNLGRYYVEESGRQIYLGEDGEKYEHDGLGNLVKICSRVYYDVCSTPIISIEETKYLQQTVGVALKKCTADVILHQPQDPILFLAQSLENYRHQEQERQSRREDEVRLMAERRERMRDLESLPAFPCPEGESDGADYNLITYNTALF